MKCIQVSACITILDAADLSCDPPLPVRACVRGDNQHANKNCVERESRRPEKKQLHRRLWVFIDWQSATYFVLPILWHYHETGNENKTKNLEPYSRYCTLTSELTLLVPSANKALNSNLHFSEPEVDERSSEWGIERENNTHLCMCTPMTLRLSARTVCSYGKGRGRWRERERERYSQMYMIIAYRHS